jgi:ABC-type sugar transport system ATPase subunit
MIRVEDLSIEAGAFRIGGISFEIPSGTYGVLMGRTGSGKTTILEAICGLRTVRAGRIWLKAGEVTALPPGQRDVGFVPQEGTLFGTKTVRQHLAFGPVLRRWPAPEIEQRVEELAVALGLERILDRKPEGLSGGERQRVALGRALAARPAVLCLDEPLSALDDCSRAEVSEVIHRLAREHALTALHITHNRDEARRFADQLLVLENGKIGPA